MHYAQDDRLPASLASRNNPANVFSGGMSQDQRDCSLMRTSIIVTKRRVGRSNQVIVSFDAKPHPGEFRYYLRCQIVHVRGGKRFVVASVQFRQRFVFPTNDDAAGFGALAFHRMLSPVRCELYKIFLNTNDAIPETWLVHSLRMHFVVVAAGIEFVNRYPRAIILWPFGSVETNRALSSRRETIELGICRVRCSFRHSVVSLLFVYNRGAGTSAGPVVELSAVCLCIVFKTVAIDDSIFRTVFHSFITFFSN